VPHNRLFVESAELYDSIYSFKNYAAECDRLRRLITKFVPGARTILDVACGTGEHARFLKNDYAVDGIDINEHYLRAARLKNPSGNFTHADLMNFDVGRTYDVVTCLFSAIAIVRTFERLERAIRRMARHVRPGGALIVEPWFTPEQWRPVRPFILATQVGGNQVYRMSVSFKEERRSVLLHHYLRGTAYDIEHYDERIELALFTRDEMTWAHEFAGMEAQYDAEGLMGRGLYICKHAAEVRPELREIRRMRSGQ
jgi:ubiquinone/menaquinone biosynthesis C-methylase UbiE